MSFPIEFTLKARDEASAQIAAVYEVMARGKNVTAEVQARFKDFRAELQAQQQAQKALEQSWLQSHDRLMKGAMLMNSFAAVGRQTTQMLTQYNTAAFRLERTQRDLADAQAEVERLEAQGLTGTTQHTRALERLQAAQQRVNEATTYYRATVAGLMFQMPGFAQQAFNIIRAWENYKIAAGGAASMTRILNAAFVSSPWGWVALAIGAIVTALYAVTGGFRNWTPVIDAVNASIQFLLKPLRMLLEAVGAFIPQAKAAADAIESFDVRDVGRAIGELVPKAAQASDAMVAYGGSLAYAADQADRLASGQQSLGGTLSKLSDFVFSKYVQSSQQFQRSVEIYGSHLGKLLEEGTDEALRQADMMISVFASNWEITTDKAADILLNFLKKVESVHKVTVDNMTRDLARYQAQAGGWAPFETAREHIKLGWLGRTPVEAQALIRRYGSAVFGDVPIPAHGGFEGTVTRPTLFLAGEAGPEHVSITPSGGGQVIHTHIYLDGRQIAEAVSIHQGRMAARWRMSPIG